MRLMCLCLIGVAMLVSIAATAGWSAPAAPAAQPGYAMIDIKKVMEGYTALNKANDEYGRYHEDVERQLAMNRRFRLLDDKELQELKDLRLVVAPTAEQKTRLQQLETLSDNREQELAVFQQKGNLTAEEQARRNMLMDIYNKRLPGVSAEEKRLIDERAKRNEAMASPFDASIKNALAKVAKQQNISVIFGTNVVVWAEKDLTEAVLTELNKNQPAAKPAAAK